MQRAMTAGLLAATLLAAGAARAATLTFEGVGDLNPVGSFYGPDYVFSPSALASVALSAGGSGDFANNPSPSTVMFFLDAADALLDVPGGFMTSLRFFYSSATPGRVRVWSGAGGTGSLLGSVDLSAQFDGGGCAGATFCNWSAVDLRFAGTALSVDFSGAADQTAFDDLAFGVAFRVAKAQVFPSSVALGNRRVGDAAPAPVALDIANIAPADGLSERLDASVGGTTGRAVATGGPISLLEAGGSSSAIAVSVDTAAAGPNGSVTIALASNGAGTSGAGVTALPSAVVALGGAVYRHAEAQVDALIHSGFFARVGDLVTRTFTIGNAAANDGFSEGLGVTGVASGGGVAFSPADGLLAPGDSRNVVATLDTATSGFKSGEIALAFTSDGAGTSGLSPVAIGGGRTVRLSATVYEPAVASPTAGTVDFGVVRVGDAAERVVTIANLAAGAFNDALGVVASVDGAGFGTAASPDPIAAGATADLAVGLNTAAAGAFLGALNLDYASLNPSLAPLDLKDGRLTLTGVVNNNAAPTFLSAGLALAFDPLRGAFVLDLGAVSLGSALNLATLGLGNLVSGPADDLSGLLYDADLADPFALVGGGALDPLGAGEAMGFGLRFEPLALGRFEGLFEFDGVGTNASDPAGERRFAALVITGVGVAAPTPAPATTWLLAAGLAALGTARRRRARS